MYEALKGKIVLVVEDDAVLLKGLAQWFTEAGCRVMIAADGQQGLDRFRQVRPDAVVTDIIMPEREGIETIMAMKAISPRTPILAISGGGRVDAGEFLTLARNLGADAILPKPFRARQVMEAVATLLESPPKAA